MYTLDSLQSTVIITNIQGNASMTSPPSAVESCGSDEVNGSDGGGEENRVEFEDEGV